MAPKARSRQVRRGETKAARKLERRELGPHRSLVVTTAKRKRYVAALTLFVTMTPMAFGAVGDSLGELDTQLVHDLEECWCHGESMSLAGDGICSVQHFCANGAAFQVRGATFQLGASTRHYAGCHPCHTLWPWEWWALPLKAA